MAFGEMLAANEVKGDEEEQINNGVCSRGGARSAQDGHDEARNAAEI